MKCSHIVEKHFRFPKAIFIYNLKQPFLMGVLNFQWCKKCNEMHWFVVERKMKVNRMKKNGQSDSFGKGGVLMWG